MTVVSTAPELIDTSELAVTLPRYAQVVQYSECQFFGVSRPVTQSPTGACLTIWTKPERDSVTRYLAEAQIEIEQVVNYPLSARWIASEEHPYRWRSVAKFGKLIEAGTKATDTILAGAVINTATDPGIIGPLATIVTDESEVHIFHPDTDVEIHPSDVSISGGQVTILVPRCRTVREAFADNPAQGLDYADLNNFESDADVRRVYNDPSTQATLNWPHGQSCPSCTAATATGCISIIDGRIGALDVMRATFSAGAWTRSSNGACGCVKPDRLFLNYRAGLIQPIDQQVAETVVRLAHAKMPRQPCGCGPIAQMWTDDHDSPDGVTLTSPFGFGLGAWTAWRWANTYALRRGGVLR